MKTVTILVGVPGSGKSHYIRKHCPGAAVVSADHFFVELGGGKYLFDVTKLGFAHGSCLREFVRRLLVDKPQVVVDNTNTSLVEITPYVALAAAYGYTVEIVRVRCDTKLAALRNTHGVPEDSIIASEQRIENMYQTGFPPFWDVSLRFV